MITRIDPVKLPRLIGKEGAMEIYELEKAALKRRFLNESKS